jgi:macrolide-specific efflux system membrane fusion protein
VEFRFGKNIGGTMKRKKAKGFLIVVILLIVGGVWYKIRKSGQNGDGRIQTATASQGSIEETVDATGEVTPLNRVEVKPPIQGRIEKLLVDEGDKVAAGQILAWMSSSDRAAILDAARAKGPEQVKQWEDAYKATPLMAPLSGVVILRNVVVGQTVDLSTVLFALSDKLIVLAHVDEVDIGRVKIGMPARIELDAYPKQPIDGSVNAILFEGKNVSNVITYGVKIEPKNVPPFFRSQMTANINLLVHQKENVVLVPSAAIRVDPSGEKRVMIPGEKNKPVARPVETGIESDGNVEIVSGLQAGETVLISTHRYSPQKGTADSPLVMRGRNQSGQGGSGAGGARGQQR